MPRLKLPMLPYDELRRAAGASCDREAADALDVSMREVVRWRKDGVPLRHADQLAIRLWMHPMSVWGQTWCNAEAEAERMKADHAAAVYAGRMERQRAKREAERLAGWAEVERSWWQWAEQRVRRVA
jgi:hypothetical protein